MIVDDEPEARDLLRMLIDPIDGVEVVCEADNVDAAAECFREHLPDLILLDIQMPRKNGFELVRMLRSEGHDPGYIFVTAYDEFAIQALRISAFDYLLKPVDPHDLSDAILRFSTRKAASRLFDPIDKLLGHLHENRTIKLNTRCGFLLIDPGEIIYCQADGNYTVIHLTGGRKETVSCNLGRLEESLPDNGFFRISRSVLVNLDFLVRLNTRSGTCTLEAGLSVELKVVRGRMAELTGRLGVS
jgi:two-component system, LytTR family, response regulator